MALLFKWNWHEKKNLAELHCHTNEGNDADAKFCPSPEEAVEAARIKGITHLCITDHNSIKGAKKAKKYVKEKKYDDIEIIIGEEISTVESHTTVKKGHVIGLGLKKRIPEDIPIEEAVEEIHKQGGVAIAAHPYTYPRRLGLRFKSFTSQFDAVECFNAVNWHLPGEWYARRMSNKYEIPIICGSDAHSTNDIGKCGIIFQGDFLDSIKSGKFKWFGRKKNPFSVLRWFLKTQREKTKKDKGHKADQTGTRY